VCVYVCVVQVHPQTQYERAPAERDMVERGISLSSEKCDVMLLYNELRNKTVLCSRNGVRWRHASPVFRRAALQKVQ
jgi:hypothetical protein